MFRQSPATPATPATAQRRHRQPRDATRALQTTYTQQIRRLLANWPATPRTVARGGRMDACLGL